MELWGGIATPRSSAGARPALPPTPRRSNVNEPKYRRRGSNPHAPHFEYGCFSGLHTAACPRGIRTLTERPLRPLPLPLGYRGLVPREGVEPSRPFGHCSLSAARLPLRHRGAERGAVEAHARGHVPLSKRTQAACLVHSPERGGRRARSPSAMTRCPGFESGRRTTRLLHPPWMYYAEGGGFEPHGVVTVRD